MKKFLNQFLVALMVLSTFTLVSCSNDEEEEFSSDIVGTWEKNWGSQEVEDFFGKQYIQFKANGQYVEVDADGNDSEGEVQVIKGYWERSGDMITVSGQGIISMSVTITNITPSTLTLVIWNFPTSYKRVDDSVIEEYLN